MAEPTETPKNNEETPLIPNIVVVNTTTEDVKARIDNAAAGVPSPKPIAEAAAGGESTPVPPKKESIKRVFVYDGREFPDPDPKMTVEEVRQYYATFMPELSNASTSESTRPVKDGTEVKDPPEQEKVVTFSKRVGTKGV